MRFFFTFLYAFALQPLISQTMLPAAEWCAQSRRLTAPDILNISDARSDSFDIVRTEIELDLSAPPALQATARLSLRPLLPGLSQLRLDLEQLPVQTVSVNGQAATFQYNSPALWIDFPIPGMPGDTLDVVIAYGGTPVTDPSGWGGVYYSNNYFFNLGVGFDADPHSFGRAWFPCFDNFVERCAFTISVSSQAAYPAYCNGALLSETSAGPGLVKRIWALNEPIPSYLACFASGPYTSFLRSYPGENGPVSVEIAAAAADTNKVKASFQNLPQAIEAFEYWFGPFQWNKIGYSLVPFNAGAMEHATNVAIMRSAIDGSLNFQTLWAHELSHHWWGDLATCSTAEDMWLNEGWAVYCEHLFTEKVNGQTAFRTAVRDNFLSVLQNAHVNEGGYRAVSGLPHSLTYGQHTYNKGAVVAHNLRGYMGDSLFRAGLRSALAQTSFQDWSSADFRDKLSLATGYNLQAFFDDWVFAGGFPDYSIDTLETLASPDSITFYRALIRQKLRGAPHYHQAVPLELTLVNAANERLIRRVQVSGPLTEVYFDVPFSFGPLQHCWLNTNQIILQARAEAEKTVSAAGTVSFSPAKFDLKVDNLGAAPMLVRVEHHFAMPDTGLAVNPNRFKLTNRYWRVYGDFDNGFAGSASVFYDGRGQLDQLDAELFAQTGPQEDSVVLIYRPGPGHPWQEHPNYLKNMLSSDMDRYGFIRMQQVFAGEYTIGKRTQGSSAVGQAYRIFAASVSPNPAGNTLWIDSPEPLVSAQLFSLDGRQAGDWTLHGQNRTSLQWQGLEAGAYWLILYGKNSICTQQIMIKN